MDFLFILLTGFVIGISGAMIPGPLTLFTISGTLKTNKFAGFKSISGHIIIELAIILVIFFGFNNLLMHKSFLQLVSVIGGMALITMGFILFVNSPKMKIAGIESKPDFDRGLVAGGAIFSLLSPGFFIWWATIGFSTLIKASLLMGIVGVVILTLGHWLADITWYGFLSYMVDKGKNYLSDKAYQNIMRFFSLALIFLGLSFLIYRK